MKTEVYLKNGAILVISGKASAFHTEEEYILEYDTKKYTFRKSEVIYVMECKN